MVQTLKYVNEVSLKMVIDKEHEVDSVMVTSNDIAATLISRVIGNSDREIFVAICLDTKGVPTYINKVHIGTLNSTLIHPREVFKLAVLSNANSIIVGHNHPSGDLEPSIADIENTKTLVSSGKVLGIQVLDHIIVSDSKAQSIRKMNPKLFETKGGNL